MIRVHGMRAGIASAVLAVGVFGGVAAPATAGVAPCDGEWNVVVDDQGVTHTACVQSAADAAPTEPIEPSPQPTPQPLVSPSDRGEAQAPSLPVTGSSLVGGVVGGVMVLGGVAASILARRRLPHR
jgi:hypothetical protein